uniref:Cyclin G2 n=1 Tax=Lates calcarifer TaxID=8187 RepID=A0A4W6EGC4_LATCA
VSAKYLCRMEKIVSEKLSVEPEVVTALTFLRLYYSILLYEIPSIGRLEAQLKACLCRLVFSKAKPSVLALSLIAQEFDALQSITLLKIVQQFQRHLKISDSELLYWKELVAKCMTEYRSAECNKPDNKKLVWIVSRRTAQNLQSVYSLVTVPSTSGVCIQTKVVCE